MGRIRIKPEWQDFERFAIRMAVKTAPRVRPHFDVDDLVQEIAVKWVETMERYSQHRPGEPDVRTYKHYFKLAAVAAKNRMIDLQIKYSTRESRLSWIRRLIDAAYNLPPADWDRMSDATRSWLLAGSFDSPPDKVERELVHLTKERARKGRSWPTISLESKGHAGLGDNSGIPIRDRIADSKDYLSEVDLMLEIEAAPDAIRKICEAAMRGEGGLGRQQMRRLINGVSWFRTDAPRKGARTRREPVRDLLSRLSGSADDLTEAWDLWWTSIVGNS